MVSEIRDSVTQTAAITTNPIVADVRINQAN